VAKNGDLQYFSLGRHIFGTVRAKPADAIASFVGSVMPYYARNFVQCTHKARKAVRV